MSSTATIADAATARAGFSKLAEAMRVAALTDTLASPGPFTVFAPTDTAFSKLPAGEMDRLMRPENRVGLTSLVTRHVLAGRLTVAELRARALASDGGLRLRTVEGDDIRIEHRADGLEIVGPSGQRAAVTDPDLMHANGVVHAMDTVLLPPMC